MICEHARLLRARSDVAAAWVREAVPRNRAPWVSMSTPCKFAQDRDASRPYLAPDGKKRLGWSRHRMERNVEDERGTVRKALGPG